MNKIVPRFDRTANAPQGYRDALAELVQVGLRVARTIGQVADAETALAEAASQPGVADGVSALASSLAEAIEADRAAAAAAEMRQTVVARTQAVADAFSRVSRSIRLTIALAERLDRGWARAGAPDERHPKAMREIARGIADATGREAEDEWTSGLVEREAPDTEDELGDRPAEEVLSEICRLLRLDPVRMTVRPALPDASRLPETGKAAPLTGNGTGRPTTPPRRQPDG